MGRAKLFYVKRRHETRCTTLRENLAKDNFLLQDENFGFCSLAAWPHSP